MSASSSRSAMNIARQASASMSGTPISAQAVRAGSSLLTSGPSFRQQLARPHLQQRAPISRSFFSLPDISKLAGFGDDSKASGKFQGSSKVETDGEQQKFHARKILPYSSQQLYSLVSDVPSYSSFIPFCTSSEVLAPSTAESASSLSSAATSSSAGSAPAVRRRQKRIVDNAWWPDGKPFDVEAELKVGFGGLEERYVSIVQGRPFESVTAVAAEESKLFKKLMTKWSFSPASPLSPHASAAPPPVDAQVEHKPNTAPPEGAPGPTLLTIDLAFTFVNPMHRIASQAVLPMVADKMIEAFEKRCLEVYGQGKA